MPPRRKLLHQAPAWLMVMAMLVVGSGWTWGNWSGLGGTGGQHGAWGGDQQVNDPTANVNQQNTPGPDRENVVSITYTNSPPTFTWGCYLPSTCWNCDDTMPYPDHEPKPASRWDYRWYGHR